MGKRQSSGGGRGSGSGSGLMARLRAFDGAFGGVPEAEAFGGLPDGTYQGTVVAPSSGVLMAEDADGALRARLILEVVASVDENLIGKKVSRSWTLIDAEGALNEIGVSFFKKDMRILGQTVIKMSDAADALQSSLGSIVQFVVKHKDDKNGVERENIYLNSLVEAASTGGTRKKGR